MAGSRGWKGTAVIACSVGMNLQNEDFIDVLPENVPRKNNINLILLVMDYLIVTLLLGLPGGSLSSSPATPQFPCPPLPPSANLQKLLSVALVSSARAHSHALSLREAVTVAAFPAGQSYDESDLVMAG